MEIRRLGVESELQLLVYTTAIATQDLSRICDLHHSSWQRWILNPLSGARDGTGNLMVPSPIRFHCATTGTMDGDLFEDILHPGHPRPLGAVCGPSFRRAPDSGLTPRESWLVDDSL